MSPVGMGLSLNRMQLKPKIKAVPVETQLSRLCCFSSSFPSKGGGSRQLWPAVVAPPSLWVSCSRPRQGSFQCGHPIRTAGSCLRTEGPNSASETLFSAGFFNVVRDQMEARMAEPSLQQPGTHISASVRMAGPRGRQLRCARALSGSPRAPPTSSSLFLRLELKTVLEPLPLPGLAAPRGTQVVWRQLGPAPPASPRQSPIACHHLCSSARHLLPAL